MLNLNFHPFPNLQTERLVLRQLSADDANEIFKLRSDEQANKYINRPRATSVNDAHTFVQRIATASGKNESVFWAIAFKNNPKLVGTVML